METYAQTVNCFDCQCRIHSLFKPLTVSECQRVSEQIQAVLYKKNEVIFHEGRQASNLYCIKHGIVKTYTVDDTGKEMIADLYGDNDSIGFRGMLLHEPYGLSAKALEDTLLCLIPKYLFQDLIANNVNFSRHVLYLMAKEMRLTQHKFIHFFHKYVRERIALKLLDFQDKFGTDKHGYLRIKLTRSEMANMVGTATESAIRLLHEMEREKILTLKRQNIKINNPELLVKMAGMR